MQVCALSDATDEEILAVCNSENPSGTSLGWCRVIRDLEEDETKQMLPVECEDHPGRTHFLVSC